jgi:cytochrome c peroxidase
MKKPISAAALFSGALVFVGAAASAGDPTAELRAVYDSGVRYSSAVEFPQQVAGDPISGQTLFGLSADGKTIDTSGALFQGTSVIAGPVVSNGRACSSCHRPDAFLKLPVDLSGIAANDPLFTGESADGQGDPRLANLLLTHGLNKYRPGRFNPTLPESSGFRQVLVWRKVQTVVNMAFGFGFLNDGRARNAVEASRGAIFAHTQTGDARFDDIANPPTSDLSAFMEAQFNPPELAQLLDPNAPLHDTLVRDPFHTVHASTAAQQRGQIQFARNCMDCHNMPNTFNNVDHVNGKPTNFPPLYGHTFDIGVAERNALDLDFRAYDGATGTFFTVVLPLVREDGVTIDVTVVDDVGAAATTGRYEDLHRFKVPGLRNLTQLAPYFHDNSAATLEDVVDYFNSDQYNGSIDGREHPIHMKSDERSDLVEFLKIL